MTQTTLNFKLQSTNEKLTPRTDVAIPGEYLKSINLKRLCNDNLPKAKHNNDYSAFEFIYPIIRAAYRSLRTNLPYLFTYKNYRCLSISNITNALVPQGHKKRWSILTHEKYD